MTLLGKLSLWSPCKQTPLCGVYFKQSTFRPTNRRGGGGNDRHVKTPCFLPNACIVGRTWSGWSGGARIKKILDIRRRGRFAGKDKTETRFARYNLTTFRLEQYVSCSNAMDYISSRPAVIARSERER